MRWLELPPDKLGHREIVLQMTLLEVCSLVQLSSLENVSSQMIGSHPPHLEGRTIAFDSWCTITDPDY